MLRTEYQTNRLLLMLSNSSLSKPVADYLIRNRDFLKDTDPLRADEFFTAEHQKSELEKDEKIIKDLSGIKFWIMKKSQNDRIIGMVAFNNIIMGPFKSCFLGYQLDAEEINKGYITEAISRCIDIMFDEIGLHRIEANIMPRNKPSLRVVEKLGFEFEGLAKKYLNINGVWEDHVHMVKLNNKE